MKREAVGINSHYSKIIAPTGLQVIVPVESNSDSSGAVITSHRLHHRNIATRH